LWKLLIGKNQGPEVFGHVVGVAVHNAGRLPAHETTLGIGTIAIDPVEVRPPPRPRLDRFLADGFQRNAARRVPGFRTFIDPGRSLPTGPPGAILAATIEIDGQINPVRRGRNFEFAIMADTLPIVPQEDFDDVAIPQSPARFEVLRRQKNVQGAIRADELQV
jgi:hypothetical protein